MNTEGPHTTSNPPPRVTVGLPVYNGERFIARAIESILTQSFSDLELIVMDNCSTDGTEAIAREYQRIDDRVRYYRNTENIGVIANFNKVFSYARGDYFKWAASDDICHYQLIERLVDELDQNPSAVMACSASIIFDDWPGDGFRSDDPADIREQGGTAIDFNRRIFSQRPMDRFRAILQTDHPGTIIYGLIRTDALNNTHLHQVDGSDRLLLTELALQGEYVHVDDRLFFRRIHDQNVDRSRREYVAMVHGTDQPGLLTPPWRWPFNYMKTILLSDNPSMTKARATAAVIRHTLRPRFLKKFIVPGPENYWGISRGKLRLVHIL